MKPWLFDILACPIDKNYPLKLYIFSYENELEEFRSILNLFATRDLNLIKNEKIFEISYEENEIFLKDNIIIEKTILKSYLDLTISSLIEFENVFDKTPNKLSKKCFELVNSDIKSRIIDFSKNPNIKYLDNILPELYMINKIKLDFEIKSGILLCTECKRWYPIIDTIPQMLPDKYRNEKNEIEFLENHKNLLDEEFFNQDLKPFNI
ncbi:MAG: Trm112 family protein [Candidatus Thorarchaeota archaeon]